MASAALVMPVLQTVHRGASLLMLYDNYRIHFLSK